MLSDIQQNTKSHVLRNDLARVDQRPSPYVLYNPAVPQVGDSVAETFMEPFDG